MEQARWQQIVERPLNLAALAFLIAYSWRVIGNLQGAAAAIANAVVFATWLVFLVNYLANLALSTDRRRWLRSHVFELLAVILPVLRPLRLLRYVRLRQFERTVGGAFRSRVSIYLAATIVLLVYMATLSVLDMERSAPGANITTFGDGLWWSLVTVTSVGYGDYYPVTLQGRIIAAGLMLCGIGMLGLVTAALASWIVERIEKTRPD
jgi:voltage-gated potassium channel